VITVTRARLLASLLLAGLVAGVAVSAPTAAQAAPSPVVPIVIVGQPTPIVGVNQGLPPLTPTQDYDAGPALAGVITAYRDSGRYQSDQRAVARAAQKFLRSWLRDECESPRRCDGRKPAAVFDIDDTLVDWYPTYLSTGFVAVPSVMDNAAENCLTPAIVAVRKVLHDAQRRGVSVFLISGRPAPARAVTVACLNKLDVANWDGLILRDPAQYALTAEQYKSAARAKIERRGYTIITSVGDQLSDMTGGHVVQGFRLPNPMYFIA
jgi:acid phosphatase